MRTPATVAARQFRHHDDSPPVRSALEGASGVDNRHDIHSGPQNPGFPTGELKQFPGRVPPGRRRVNVRTTATPDRTKSTLRRKEESSDNCRLDSTSQ
jgi:hypothetical protein